MLPKGAEGGDEDQIVDMIDRWHRATVPIPRGRFEVISRGGCAEVAQE